MFYAYRIGQSSNMHQIVRAIHKTEPVNTQFSPKEFFKLIRTIGWDGTWTGELYSFGVPGGPVCFACLAILEGTAGRWFIGTPIELAYLNGLCDWDGYTDSEQVKRIIADIQGDDPARAPAIRLTRKWAVNAKGTLVASINGCTVCVIEAKYGQGFVGLIFGAGDRKVTTPALPTKESVQAYLLNNFSNLTKEWTYVDPDDPDDSADDDEEPIIIYRPLK